MDEFPTEILHTHMARFSWRGVRRFLVFQAFLVWQGGFLFYAAVVVPLGTEVLDSAFRQGMITRQVTGGLNWLGVLFLAMGLWDVSCAPFKRRASRVLLLLTAVGLAALVGIRVILSAEMDPTASSVRNVDTFRAWHILYLWISTLHWLMGMALTILTYRAWQAEDRNLGVDERIG